MPKFLFNILALISLVVNVFFVADFSYASEPAQKIVRIGYAIPVNYKGNPDTIHKSGYTYEYSLMIASFLITGDMFMCIGHGLIYWKIWQSAGLIY